MLYNFFWTKGDILLGFYNFSSKRTVLFFNEYVSFFCMGNVKFYLYRFSLITSVNVGERERLSQIGIIDNFLLRS